MGSRLVAALAAASTAIVANTLVLQGADFIPLATARGGLLRLVRPALSRVVALPTGAGFQIAFHLFVGILMGLFYAYVLEPRLPGRPWRKGIVYAAAVWLLNACLVLPATGEGFAGAAHLTVPGMIWFGVAHTVFFVALAQLYASLLPMLQRGLPAR